MRARFRCSWKTSFISTRVIHVAKRDSPRKPASPCHAFSIASGIGAPALAQMRIDEMSFVAPSVGAQQVQVSGYEIRIRASDEMTAANFATSMPVTAHVDAATPGELLPVQCVDRDLELIELGY